MKHKLTYILTYLTFSAMLIGGGVYLYWNFQPLRVLDIKNIPVPVRPKEISPEATVILHYNYCKKSNIPGVVTGAIVSNSTKVLLPDANDLTPKSCREFDTAVIIPGQTTDGVYHLEYKATYHINPIKIDVETWQSQEFVVKHVPPLPAPSETVTPITPTTDITTTPTQSTTKTNDGQGNTPSTTTNNPPVAKPNPIQRIMDVISNLLGRIKL